MTIRALLVAAALLSACQASAPPPDPDRGLPDPSDGKADAPLGDLRQRIDDLVEGFSATRGARYYPTAAAGVAEIARLVRAGGVADPNDAIYVVYVGRFDLGYNGWQHSELRIGGALGPHGEVIPLGKRTVGDPNGAGLFDDQDLTRRVGPRLCMTWSMLQAAIGAAYLDGVYGVSFVCHTATLAALQAAGVAPEYYQSQIGGWLLARWVYGPWLGSGIAADPDAWPAACGADATRAAQSGLAP